MVNIDVWHPDGIFFGADNYTSGTIAGLAASAYAKKSWGCKDVWVFLGEHKEEGAAVTVIVLLAVFAVLGAALPRTSFGRYAYAIGSSAPASRLPGVPVSRWRLAFYGTCGVLAALAGIITVARTGTAQPSQNLGLDST